MTKNQVFEVVKKMGSPIYIYDEKVLKQRFSNLKSCFPNDNFSLYYSVKANPLVGICRRINSLGGKFEVASGGELAAVLKSGAKGTDIIFSGPGKNEQDIQYAIRNSVKCINVESLEEVSVINSIVKKEDKKVNILLRINPMGYRTNAKIKMSGVATQFGIDTEQLDGILKSCMINKRINVVGIQCYFGTQILDAQEIKRNIVQIFDYVKMIEIRNHMNFKYVNVGGGFGTAYFKGEKNLKMDELKNCIREIQSNYNDFLSEKEIMVESGRYLLGDCGILVLKVLYTKKCKDTNYLICDGGSNIHGAAAFLGRHIRNNFPIELMFGDDRKEKFKYETVTVVGPLCTPTDIIAQDILLPKAKAGDYIVVKKSGAYGLTHSPILFLSHIIPSEVLVQDNKLIVLRERMSVEQFFLNQKEEYICELESR